MARTSTNRRNSFATIIMGVAVLLIAIMVLTVVMLRTAQGTGAAHSTIGFGESQSTQNDHLVSEDKFNIPEYNTNESINDKSASSSSTLTRASHRSIIVNDPEPVIAYAAVDLSNEQTVAFAEEHGTLNAFPTAERLLPDVSGEGWQHGSASGYDLEDNDGWDATASGVKLTRTSVTVAVPLSQSYLLGRTVQIVYEDKVVMATVTDVGGFGGMGRALDLGPGVWKAFGASTPGEWGVRSLHYRFM